MKTILVILIIIFSTNSFAKSYDVCKGKGKSLDARRALTMYADLQTIEESEKSLMSSFNRRLNNNLGYFCSLKIPSDAYGSLFNKMYASCIKSIELYKLSKTRSDELHTKCMKANTEAVDIYNTIEPERKLEYATKKKIMLSPSEQFAQEKAALQQELAETKMKLMAAEALLESSECKIKSSITDTARDISSKRIEAEEVKVPSSTTSGTTK